MHESASLWRFCRYVFPDEASAEASLEGRSADFVVARSEEEALAQARERCVEPLIQSALTAVHTCCLR